MLTWMLMAAVFVSLTGTQATQVRQVQPDSFTSKAVQAAGATLSGPSTIAGAVAGTVSVQSTTNSTIGGK